jgi:hypothetical protein
MGQRSSARENTHKKREEKFIVTSLRNYRAVQTQQETTLIRNPMRRSSERQKAAAMARGEAVGESSNDDGDNTAVIEEIVKKHVE